MLVNLPNKQIYVGASVSLSEHTVLQSNHGTLNYASGDCLTAWNVLPGRGRAEVDLLPASADDNASASGIVQITLAAPGWTQRHEIFGVGFGYLDTPAPGSGSLQIESPSGTIIWGPIPVIAAGMGFQDFPRGLQGGVDTPLVITLTDALCNGEISIKGRRVV